MIKGFKIRQKEQLEIDAVRWVSYELSMLVSSIRASILCYLLGEGTLLMMKSSIVYFI